MAVYYPACYATLQVVFDGFGQPDSRPTIIDVEPITATASLNGYREADSFELEFDAAMLPISPELIRSVGVQLYIFQKRSGSAPFENYLRDPENLTVVGLADEVSISYDSNGRRVRIQGRDYTALIADKLWDTSMRVPLGKPLDQTVQDLVDAAVIKAAQRDAIRTRALALNPVVGGAAAAALERSAIQPLSRVLKVRYVGEDDLPTVGAVDRTVTQRSVSEKPQTTKAKSRTKKAGLPVASGRNYWDVIYQLCLSYGHVAYVRGVDVVIAKPNVLTEVSRNQAAKVAYGRNLETLRIDRKLGKEAVPQIIACSYDPRSRKRIEARWPPTAQQKVTGAGTVKEEIRRVTPPAGITDVETLRAFCRAYYETVARTEGKLSFTTKALKDLDGKDLLRLRPGLPVQISWDDIKDEDFRQLSTQQRYSRLIRLGYGEQVSALIAHQYDHIKQFRTPFYTTEVALSWSNTDGVSLSVSAMNYIAPQRDNATS